MPRFDRNRIDRLPTKGERWVGIVLSALIAVVFLSASILILFLAWSATIDRFGLLVMAAVFGTIGGVGSFLFYRMVFTEPRAASKRANQFFAYFAVVVGALMVVISFVAPASGAQRVTAAFVMFSAVGYVVAARRSVRTEKKEPRDAL